MVLSALCDGWGKMKYFVQGSFFFPSVSLLLQQYSSSGKDEVLRTSIIFFPARLFILLSKTPQIH